MRVAGLVSLVTLGLLLAGCGGEEKNGVSEPTTTASDEVAAPAWAVPTLSKPGPESALVMASSDFATGDNRVAFLLIRDDGSAVEAPTLSVSYEPTEGAPVRTTEARLVPLGAEGAEPGDVTSVYVAELDELATGKRWMLVEPPTEQLQGFQILDVKAKSITPAIGDHAPRSQNPTLATAAAEKITTARPPDLELLRHTVADSIDAGIPFVVVFATPQFCQTRACGPTVDVVEAARKRFTDREVRFIHIEIYVNNTPGEGVNRWVREWKLPSEPWIFVVDAKGVIRDKFEGAVAADEIEVAVRSVLRS